MNLLIFFIVSSALMLCTYIATLSFLTSIIVFVLSFAIFALFSLKKIIYYSKIKKKYYSCYKFINNFIISLNIKKTISSAFTSVNSSMDEDYIKEYNDLEHMTDNEKLEYLNNFYPFHIYSLFVGVVNLYEEQGGNILSLASLVLDKSRIINEYIQSSYSKGIRKIVEFFTLWIFSIVILLVLRLVLKDFYSLLASKVFFQIMIACLMVFIAITIHIAIVRFTNIKVRGWNNENV
jgi:hypothetical protein